MSQLNIESAKVRTRVSGITLVGALYFGLALLVIPGGGISAAPWPSGIGNQANLYAMCWQVVPSPNASTSHNVLSGVAVVSANDAWAVGNFLLDEVLYGLVERWNGSSWQGVYNPSLGGSSLSAVAAVSANDVWAVGRYYDVGAGAYRTVTEHWNGSTWTVVPSPNQGTDHNVLSGVTTVSASNVWAVGYYEVGTIRQTLVEHWDGSTWTIVPSPNQGTYSSSLTAIAAISANDVWAVGNFVVQGAFRTLVEHWDGSTWTIVPSPNQGTYSSSLAAIAAISANDVWAVGDGSSKTLVEHWNGSTWTIVPSPNQGLGNNYLRGVTAVSANDLWAVGQSYNWSAGAYQTLVEHWDGSTWTIVPSPNQGTEVDSLYAVAAVSASEVWAVGFYENLDTQLTLVERYALCSITPVPATPTATRTPGPPTATPTPCTAGVYSDVPPGSTFYPYVTCLATRGIVSGYADCTFRPGNNVTRGQLSKIVSNAANFNEPHSTQTFEDVPLNHAFYIWIERLASRGIIGGYACGGQGEPCVPPGNKPYFRSGSNVTRGQTSKIVAIARGLPEPPSGQRTFEDVPQGSTFWPWVEALAGAGAISGYPCGGSGEPCMPPTNRPYFRAGNNVTRGQSSKIVANTFFPECQTLDR
jgi:hypothetical protein